MKYPTWLSLLSTIYSLYTFFHILKETLLRPNSNLRQTKTDELDQSGMRRGRLLGIYFIMERSRIA